MIKLVDLLLEDYPKGQYIPLDGKEKEQAQKAEASPEVRQYREQRAAEEQQRQQQQQQPPQAQQQPQGGQ